MKINRSHINLIIFLLAIVGGAFYHFSTISNIESKYNEALTFKDDSIELLALTNMNMMYVKRSLRMEMEMYKDSISILQESLSKANKGEISSITDIQTIVTFDTIYIPLLKPLEDTPKIFSFKHKSDIFSMTGSIESDSLIIDTLSIPSNLTVGYTDTGFVFATSDNPYVHIKSITSNIQPITPPPEYNLSHAISIGVGFNYGLIHKEIDFGPCIAYSFIIEF